MCVPHVQASNHASTLPMRGSWEPLAARNGAQRALCLCWQNFKVPHGSRLGVCSSDWMRRKDYSSTGQLESTNLELNNDRLIMSQLCDAATTQARLSVVAQPRRSKPRLQIGTWLGGVAITLMRTVERTGNGAGEPLVYRRHPKSSKTF